jgi:hypothetical protein
MAQRMINFSGPTGMIVRFDPPQGEAFVDAI